MRSPRTRAQATRSTRRCPRSQLRIAKEKLKKAIDERKAALDAYEKAKVAKEEAKEKDATLKKMEAELEAAAKNLRKHRNADGGPHTKGQNGGVYRISGAKPPATPLAAVAAAVIAYLYLA